MRVIIGYVVSVVGLVIMVLGFGTFGISILEGIGKTTVSIVGIVLVILGIIFVMRGGRKSSKKKISEEVPIYEGKGKDRKVVGYQRED